MFNGCLGFGKILLCLLVFQYIYVGANPLLKRFVDVGVGLARPNGFV